MNFKKNYINKKKNNNILNIVWIISIWLIFIVALIFIKNINLIKIEIDEKNLLETNIQKDEDEKSIIKDFLSNKNKDSDSINILLTWRWGWSHDAPNLTDTIILIKLDTDNKLITMLSVPRDLYVEYDNLGNWGKINWLFAKYSFENNSKEYWMEILKNKISEITWEKIDFFINIDFNWFKDIIDTIWGIKITIPDNFVDYQYPDWNWWYKTLVFKKWTWLFDWENALKYVRSRHSTSDFDRSLRQQQVIKSIKEKLTWSYFLTSPWKIRELYDVFNENVYTDLTLTKVIKIAYSLSSNKDSYDIISSNMNDSCFYWSTTCDKWWILYIPSREFFNWMSVLLIDWTEKWNLSNYELSKTYSNIVFNYPLVNKENASINIFNSVKVNHLAWELSNNVKKYWFNIPEKNSIWNTPKTYKNSVIYFNNLSEDSETIKLMKQFFVWEYIKLEWPKYSKERANIEIIIWEDYVNSKWVFKF